MEPIIAAQSWTYRAPKSFEQSRLIVGAVVEVENATRLVCCSVVGAPWRLHAAPYEILTIPFLPMTESAFRASVDTVEGVRPSPHEFIEAFERWRADPRGLTAFTVPFEGFLDLMIDLQNVWRKGATRRPTTDIKPVLNAMTHLLAGNLRTVKDLVPQTKQEFDAVLARLRALEPDDLRGKLIIAGFQNHPLAPEQKRCLECTYFLPNSSWCDLPEISLPVEPYWSCRLWSI